MKKLIIAFRNFANATEIKTFKIIAVPPVTLIGQLNNRISVFIYLLAQKSLFMNLKIKKPETYQAAPLRRRKFFICRVSDFYTELGWHFLYDYMLIKVILQASVDTHVIDYDP